MGTILGKTDVIRNWCCSYYKEILESFAEIILVKLEKNYEEVVKNRKHFVQTFKKTFWSKFCEISEAVYGRTHKKLYGNFKEF